ncbi:MAG: sulfotransferase domain-containing protein [Desulfohalobiaceae bacterium]|nr:sulfotransferase domain-containing protein [Desulfohalobiaceae bacterium]
MPDDFLFVRYEDLHWTPRETLRSVLQFIGEKNLREDLLEQSIVNCSFKRMKHSEATYSYRKPLLRPAAEGDQESCKARKGTMGGSAEYLSRDDVASIDAVLAEHGFDFADFKA